MEKVGDQDGMKMLSSWQPGRRKKKARQEEARSRHSLPTLSPLVVGRFLQAPLLGPIEL